MAVSEIIHTPRLTVEPFAERHLTARYVNWLNNPEVTRYSDQRHYRHTPASCREYFESFRDGPNYFWAVMVHENQLGHVGTLNAYVNTNHFVADIGILIGETAAHGQGYATEAWLGVCDFLLRTAGLYKVTAGTMVVNEPMVKLMRRAGMAEDGRRARQCLWNGREVDVVYAACFREEWLRRFPQGPFVKS